MADVLQRLHDLSPERRRLLELRLKVRHDGAAGPALRPRPRTDGTAPLSFAQARLWVLDRMDPGSAAYDMPHPLRIRGALDVAALRAALHALVARHETLRTTFAERENGPVQVIHPPAPLPLPVADSSDLSGEAREAEVRRRVDEDANTGFDLVAGPLVRASLLRLSGDEHVLLLCMHHAVSDGWSMGVFARELGALYAAAREGRDAGLPPLPVQYADFAAWQREELRGGELERLAAFWRRTLEGAPPALELPADHPRPAAESHRGSTLKSRIAPELANRLRELARAEGATLFNVLAAAFRAVLARHSGQADVVIGTPVANRQRSELEGLIGFFVNTLPLRARVDAGESFRALVRRESETALAAFEHRALPFDRIVEELRLPRDPARNPVFQAMVTLQNARMDPVALGGVEITPLAPEYHTAKFDLTLDHYEEDDGAVRMEAEYATDLFDAATVERLAGHVHALLAGGAAHPDAPLRTLAAAAPGERDLVAAANATAAAYEREMAVHRVFEARANESPDAVAVEFGDSRLTYAEVDARATALARRLRAAGIGIESRVGVAMERSAELVIALLAALKAGAAYVPLDPSYPAERLRWMVEDARVAALLVRGGVPAALGGFAGAVIDVAGDGDAGDAAALPEVPAEALAYVVYTSGSTGTPKGIGIPHRAVVRLVRETEYVPFGPAERIAQASNASFDALTFEVWGALLNGGTLVGLDRDAILDPHALADELRGRRITAAFLTTALFNQVARHVPSGFAGMRHLLAGGEAADPAAFRAVLAAGGPGRLLNVYGPTESTTFATSHDVVAVPDDVAGVPIGGPIANTAAYVADADGRGCNLGEPGELLLGGDGVARGYLGRPALTAERFVPDAFGGVPGARLYRTGDRVRWKDGGADGRECGRAPTQRPDERAAALPRPRAAVLEFLGRLDDQVKVRGFRIEPGEIEAALRALPEVRDCAVVARREGGAARLVAYVAATEGAAPSPSALRDALASRLPEHMVPGAFVLVDAIPLTPNGKVDRRALPAPDASASPESPSPEGETETALAAIWAEVLGASSVGAEDDFFLSGGHSLLATQVVSRIRREFAVELPLRALFEAPTVRRLAARVDALRGTGEAPLPPVTPVDRAGPLPASFAQERMWVIERMEPGAGLYNMPVRIRLRGAVDGDALRRALETVVHRHEALRTRIREADGAPVQEVAAPEPVHLPVIDAADEAEARRILDDEAWRPVDLEHGPVLRALLVRVRADEQVLALNVHHALADGWSLGIVLRELSAAYAALVAGAEPALPPVPLQYGDFAAWQRTHLTPERVEAEAAWWRGTLSGAPPLLDLPGDHPRPARRTLRGGAVPVRIPAEAAGRIRALAAAEGATPFMALLAAFQALLGRLANQDDIVAGTPVAGRRRAETEGIVGLFVNTLALRADLSADPTFRALVAQVRETTLAALAHQDLPFEKVVEALGVERSLSHAPVFQAMFELTGGEAGRLEIAGAAASFDELSVRAAKFDLALALEDAPDGGWEGALEFAADLFEPETAARIAARYATLAAALAAAPDARISAAPALLPGERERLAAWSDGGPALPPVSAPELFARTVGRRPYAPALVFESTVLSYAALDRRAGELAARLRETGVGADTVVAIMLERGPEQVIATLAVWKAGGAYLPIDPLYPADRRAYMLADSRAAVLVTRPALAEGLETAGARVIDVAAALAEAEGRTPPPAPDLHPAHLAYVIYTSGSTGRPKGVMVTHAGLANLASAVANGYGITPGTRVLQFASFSFDAALADIVGTFAVGGTLVVAPADALLPGKPLLATLAEQRVNTGLLPPSLWAVLPESDLPELQTAVSGGEACAPDVVARWSRGRRFVNAYGPTEATVASTMVELEGTPRRVPLGPPLPGVRAQVMGRGMQPAAPGVPGELCVGGPGVARGYLGRPGLTAERFVPDPSSPTPGARMYRTGDLARWRADGWLEYLGRADFQVKLRGFRIEPGEIAAALEALPGVREAIVLIRTSPAGDGRLVGYVTPKGDVHPDGAALRDALRQSLPEHMVPAEVVALSKFPLTLNGKVDRAALPAPAWGATPGSSAPRGPTEEVLAEMWRRVLGVDRVGRGDSFFGLGGHSLLAAKVVSRIRGELGIDLPLRELFDAGTLAELASRVEAARARGAGVPDVPVAPVRRDGPLPLSPAQERLWFLWRLNPASTAYNMPLLLRLCGALDADALARALAEIVRRHEALRTVFARTPHGPAQVILPPSPGHLPLSDLRAEPDPEAALRALLDAEARTPFDLERGPLLRLRLARVAEDAHALIVGMHHIVGDAWSLTRFHAELSALYAAFAAGEPSPLAELPVQYADFAAWQRERLHGDWVDRETAYWTGKLAGAPVLELPADRPRAEMPDLAGAGMETALEPGLAERLEAAGREEGATPFMAWFAVFAALLARWADESDVVVGSAVAGRGRPEVEGVIGFFVNALALRVDLSGDPSFAELLRRVRETTLEAYAHQDLPFERVIDAVKPERVIGRHPLTPASFTLHHDAPAPAPSGLAIELDSETGDSGAAKSELTLGIVRGGDAARCSWEYAADLFDPETIARLAARFAALARAAADHPHGRLSELFAIAGDAGAGDTHVHRAHLETGQGLTRRGEQASLASASVAAARPEVERVVAGAWREVLGREGIGPNDNFFDVGGHSLLAARLQEVLETVLAREIPLVDLFRRPTIRSFAAGLETAVGGAKRGEERGEARRVVRRR